MPTRPTVCLNGAKHTAFLYVLILAPVICVAQGNDGYPLDEVARRATVKAGKVTCPKVSMRKYRGDVLRYHAPVWVYRGFVHHLRLFEEVVKETALEFYGRAPHRIRHMGTYNCRIISGWPDLISEHGLGNGIDIAGFDFRALPRSARRSTTLSKALQRPFKVRLKTHWNEGKNKDIHARFLDTLARRLVARKDIFRVLLGPSYPGHKNHFHFDMSPWRLVDIWSPEAAP